MIVINEKEYNEIISAIERNCCKDCSPYICSEADCGIQEIYRILNKHLCREFEFDYCNNDMGIDEELPFDL